MARRLSSHRSRSNRLVDEFSIRGIRLFSYESLRIATKDFTTLIGEGGISSVYKGVLDDGSSVAIKKLKPKGRPASNFVSIIDVMSHIGHRNLNRVIGCCVENGVNIIVSEYAENGTLFDMIGDSERRSSIFNWEMRLAICIGISRGIAYLHEDINPQVIHRDIKPGNILLDSNFTPKITDFDLVDLVYESDVLPHEDDVVGTFGYIDPEYVNTGVFTEKVDVYAFGVLMLETVSGRRVYDREYNGDDQLICSWVSRLPANDMLYKIIDPLLSDFTKDRVLRFIDVALLCTREQSSLRPSMYEVVLLLSEVCNPCRQVLRMLHMRTEVDTSYTPASPTGTSTAATDVDDGGSSILQGKGNVKLAQSKSTEVSGDCDAKMQAPDELHDKSTYSRGMIVPTMNDILQNGGVETYTALKHRDEDHLMTGSIEDRSLMGTNSETYFHKSAQQQNQQQQQKCRVTLSGSDRTVERLSKTMVMKKYSRHVCMEAVYPPYLTREYSPLSLKR